MILNLLGIMLAMTVWVFAWSYGAHMGLGDEWYGLPLGFLSILAVAMVSMVFVLRIVRHILSQ